MLNIEEMGEGMPVVAGFFCCLFVFGEVNRCGAAPMYMFIEHAARQMSVTHYLAV